MALPKTPIKRRLQLVILLTSLAVLLITSTAFILYELIASSQELQRNVCMAAHIVADQLPTSLIYQSVEDAEEVLAALKSAENIEAAALYDTNGTLFVYYPPMPCPRWCHPLRRPARAAGPRRRSSAPSRW